MSESKTDDNNSIEPKQWGDYILGETLGQGSFGKVKLAINKARGNEQVAIKIVDKSNIADVEDVERVYRETFILTSLKHKNIIRLNEVMNTPKSILLAMEYAGGGDLYHYVAQRQRLSELDSCRMFQQILGTWIR
jgi:serine/threonine protein kinase